MVLRFAIEKSTGLSFTFSSLPTAINPTRRKISVTVSRTMSAPTNKYVKAQYIHIPILTPSFPADKTRVNVPIKF